jgi:long-chain acyl-CoA synthetase
MTRPFPWEASYPPGLSWDVPLEVTTLPAMLDRAVAAFADRPAITFRDRSISFRELGRRLDQLARGLYATGVRRGDAVGLLLPNTPAHPVAFFAALRIGARVVHLSPLDPARGVARKLADSGARTLITTNLAIVLPQAIAAAVDRLVVADDAEWGPSDTLPIPQAAMVLSTLDGPPIPWPLLDPHDVALLQFTGGTTAQPRAAQLTHANLTAAVAIYDAWNNGLGRTFRAGDRILCVLPLFHIYALTAVLLRAIRNGVEVVLHPRFHCDAVLDAIEGGRCTHMNGVPTMWIALADAPGIETRDLSSLRVASSGGAALPHDVGERFHALTGLRLGGGWGMTETSPAGTNLLPDREAMPGEIGVPLPGVELGVVALDDPRRRLPPGGVGELRIRGPNVTPGYWNRPAENQAAFVDGWFMTGDVGFMEPDGRFVLVDRKKDMLISGGYNVYPRAIEEAIHEHPDVQEAAVIGVPDPYRGQAAKAFVVMREGRPDLTLETLRAFLSERLGRHELPTALETRDSLPRTPVGKLAKRELA